VSEALFIDAIEHDDHLLDVILDLKHLRIDVIEDDFSWFLSIEQDHLLVESSQQLERICLTAAD